MKFQNQLAKIWSNYENNVNIPSFVKERRFGFYENKEQKDILILGVQPSFGKNSIPKPTKYNMLYNIGIGEKMNLYQSEIRAIIKDNDLDLFSSLAYMDLFYFRSTIYTNRLNLFLDTIDGIGFLADQLELSRNVLEKVIKPKVIILNSKVAGILMGLYEYDFSSVCSMSYKFKKVDTTISGYSVYKIVGFAENYLRDNTAKVKSNLLGTYVICYPVLLEKDFFKKKKRLGVHEVEYYKELALLDQEMSMDDPKSLSTIDVDLLLKYTDLYYYDLKNDKSPEAAYAKIILKDLSDFKSLSTSEMAQSIFTKLSERKILTKDDVLDLRSGLYCYKTFKMKHGVLSATSVNQARSFYFKNSFNLIGDEKYYVTNRWTVANREDLERWFVNICYYSRLSKI